MHEALMRFHLWDITSMENHELRNNLRKAYNRYAQERETSDQEEWKIEERSRYLSALQQRNKKSLLEIGAGTGRDSKFFQDQGLEVVCIDLSPIMVDLCKQKGLTAYVMDMIDIDFANHSFDAIYAMNSLLHLTKMEFPAVLHRMNSLLKDEGLVYIGMYGGSDFEGIWYNDPYRPKRFFSYFTDAHLEEQAKKVFDILAFNRVLFEKDTSFHFQSLILKKRGS